MTQSSGKVRNRRHQQTPTNSKRLEPSGDRKQNGGLRKHFEQYQERARHAAMSGDDIAAEGHYQHAEHYYRLMNASVV